MPLSAEVAHWLTSLRRHRKAGRPSPHKPVMLLAVLELAERGRLAPDGLRFDEPLLEAFAAYWEAVSEAPVGRASYPFWHLQSSPFWTVVPRPGFESRLKASGTSPSGRQMGEQVDGVRLDPRFAAALADAGAREEMCTLVVAHYFPEAAQRIAEVRAFEGDVERYARLIQGVHEVAVSYQIPAPVRDAAFRRVVMTAYDYTCALTGARVTLEGSGTQQLVQAAHIHDWALSRSDDPANGIALSPNAHWLFERGLFTIDDRYRVLVSPVASSALGNAEEMLSPFRNAELRLPVAPHLRPHPRYLAWHRSERFLRS